MNNVMYAYTFKDLLKKSFRTIALDKDKIVSFLRCFVMKENDDDIDTLSKMLSLHNINMNDLFFLKNQDGAQVINITPYSKLLNLIKLRFQNNYVVICENKIPNNIDLAYKNDEVLKFCEKFLEILFYSKDKYVNILNIYQDNINKLMNPLKSTHRGTGSTSRHEDYDTDMTGKNLFNDTPQTTDVVATIEGNQYVSELSKSQAHTDNVGDISEDREDESVTESDAFTTMAKIKEIQESYDMTLKNWSNEFAGLFMEEV